MSNMAQLHACDLNNPSRIITIHYVITVVCTSETLKCIGSGYLDSTEELFNNTIGYEDSINTDRPIS
jgi:hypothetical protein